MSPLNGLRPRRAARPRTTASLARPAVLGILGVLTCCTAHAFGEDHRAAGPDKSGDGLIESDVRFTVHNPEVPGAAGEATVHGTLIRPAKMKKASGTAVILLHGASSDRTSWMGPIDGVYSMAHGLAKRGHAVFALDRLGYRESVYDPFPGAGWTITPNTQVETIHEIVTQIRNGGYRVAEDASDSGSPVRADRAADHVVLVGLSIGAGEAQCYATRYHDVDGVVSLGWSNQQPQGEAVRIIFDRFIIPQLMLGLDHVYFFPPSDGFSEECAWVFHAPGADPAVMSAVCTDGFLTTTPSGELAGVADLTAETLANLHKVTTPVFLVYGEFDTFFPGPGYRGLFGNDPDIVTPDITQWRSRSGGPVDVLLLEDTGHAIPFHDSAKQVTREIARWIDDL